MTFQDEWQRLRNDGTPGQFEYAHAEEDWSSTVDRHFNTIQVAAKYGVYLARRVDTNEVIYIGRAGTLRTSGEFKKQDLPGRLKASRQNDTSANRWFRDLGQAEGALRIEYIILKTSPKSPALAEALSLQAFLDEHHVLPRYNNSF